MKVENGQKGIDDRYLAHFGFLLAHQPDQYQIDCLGDNLFRFLIYRVFLFKLKYGKPRLGESTLM